jgi:cyclophilin family peptidyl-prolyl cis-trans isomerase
MSDASSTPPADKSSSRGLLYGIAAIVLIGLAASAYVLRKPADPAAPGASDPTAQVNAANPAAPAANPAAPAAAPADAATAKTPYDLSPTEPSGLSKAVVTIETPKGNIKFRFWSKDAPNTSARIAELVHSGFYNGLTFHRVEPGFVVQGGDPSGNGTGGSGRKQNAEFNRQIHILGSVAMARRGDDVNSADSQFYIALAELPSLDGQYTVFGQVVEGIEVVQKIQVGDKMTKVTIQ